MIIVNWVGGLKMEKKNSWFGKKGVIIIIDFLVINIFKCRGDVDSC